MSALAADVPTLKSSLLCLRELLADTLWHYERKPLYYVWIAKNRWPRLVNWFWCMVHRAEWQKSTAQSIAFWMAATPVIFHVAHQLGNGVRASLMVSLAVDWLVFVLNKLWVWRKRNAEVPRCAFRNFLFWAATFLINLVLTWQVIGHVGLHHGRTILGCYGCLMNPVVFAVRDRLVFVEANAEEKSATLRRLDALQASAAAHLARWKTGGV